VEPRGFVPNATRVIPASSQIPKFPPWAHAKNACWPYGFLPGRRAPCARAHRFARVSRVRVFNPAPIGYPPRRMLVNDVVRPPSRACLRERNSFGGAAKIPSPPLAPIAFRALPRSVRLFFQIWIPKRQPRPGVRFVAKSSPCPEGWTRSGVLTPAASSDESDLHVWLYVLPTERFHPRWLSDFQCQGRNSAPSPLPQLHFITEIFFSSSPKRFPPRRYCRGSSAPLVRALRIYLPDRKQPPSQAAHPAR